MALAFLVRRHAGSAVYTQGSREHVWRYDCNGYRRLERSLFTYILFFVLLQCNGGHALLNNGSCVSCGEKCQECIEKLGKVVCVKCQCDTDHYGGCFYVYHGKCQPCPWCSTGGCDGQLEENAECDDEYRVFCCDAYNT